MRINTDRFAQFSIENEGKKIQAYTSTSDEDLGVTLKTGSEKEVKEFFNYIINSILNGKTHISLPLACKAPMPLG